MQLVEDDNLRRRPLAIAVREFFLGMTMPEITLPNGKWRYDDRDPLGPPGGFGEVFRGCNAAGGPSVAVKRLRTPYQSREMKIADFLLGHDLAHVISILDAGYDVVANTNFIVMPVAEKSLQQEIEANGLPNELEVLEILNSIASGLEEIGDLIHRDLKPGNILFHENVWKLADLGLARFAEVTTSIHTMRGSRTPAYAAPEQWRNERPTKATDVYSFGCIMYALLHGAPPFAGPDFSHQHQFEKPAALGASAHLRRLAAYCLSKAPELRPSIQTLCRELQIAREVANEVRPRELATIAAEVAEERLLAEQQAAEHKSRIERRRRLAKESIDVVASILADDLAASVLRDAPNALDTKVVSALGLKSLSLGDAILEWGILFEYDDLMTVSGYTSYKDNVPHAGNRVGSTAWDVLAGAYVSVSSRWNTGPSRSANLWFGQLLEGDDYRWWEVSYCYRDDSQLPSDVKRRQPFGLLRIPSHFSDQVAEDPQPVTPGFVESFVDRWIGWFAVLARGESAAADGAFPNPFRPQIVSSKFKVDRR